MTMHAFSVLVCLQYDNVSLLGSFQMLKDVFVEKGAENMLAVWSLFNKAEQQTLHNVLI